MSERKRAHRKDAARLGPIRNFANLYRRPDREDGNTNSVNGASASVVHPKMPGADQPSPDQLSEGVGLAYRVIDEYISQGRKAAQQFSKQSHQTGPPTRPLQEIVDRMLRYQAEMLPLWLDLFGSLARVDSFRAGSPSPPKARAMNNGAAAAGGNVSIEVTSRRQVEVSVDVDHDSTRAALVTPGLHALDQHKPGLTDVRFVPANGRRPGKVSIKIRDRQPPGSYSGVLVDPRSGETRGTLSIRIADGHSTAGTRSK